MKIDSLQKLAAAANNKLAVIVPKDRGWNRPRPAAFMIHQPGIVLLGLFRVGMFIYKK